MLSRPGETWPTFEGEPMLLLAQIDFSECVGLIEGIPSCGILQALIAQTDPPDTHVPGEGQPTRFRILDESEPLTWIESGIQAKSYGLEFNVRGTVGEGDIPELTEEESDFVKKALFAEGHRILGFPLPIQYDILEEPHWNPNRTRILALQIDSDDRLGWNWGDQGCLYFLADAAAYAKGKLEDTLFEMQFY